MDRPHDLTAGRADADSGLRRNVGFPLLLLYGLGTTVGAGVYALVGEVAGLAGAYAPAAFVVSALLATATALAFAELSSRHPRAAGEAEYVARAFGRPGLSRGVGLAVAAAGTISAATVARGFAGYVGAVVSVPTPLLLTLLIVVLGGVAAWGVRESLRIAGAMTLLEVGGLLAVVTVVLVAAPETRAALPVAPSPVSAAAVLSASTLAFFAFLGFEDMVNVAEEVTDVRRTLPRAILWTLGLTTLIYAAVAWAAVVQVAPAELAASEAPLALVYERALGRAPVELLVIGALAMLNGALIQIVMASRVLYGLGERGLVPRGWARVHPRTGTPVFATILVSATALLLALALPLASLARATAWVALAVFACIHAALFVLQRREPAPPGAFVCPRFVPPVGGAVSLLLLGFEAQRVAP